MYKKGNFIPDKDYIISSISILFDLIEIYKDNILNLIDDDTSRKITFFCEESKDGEIISLNEALKNYKTSAQYNSQLNQEDIF